MTEQALAPMTRDQIKAILELADKVVEALEVLPYRDAVGPIQSLSEIVDIVSEPLPGHEAVICGQCDEVRGIDEMQDCGDERFCTTCVARWEDPVEKPTEDGNAQPA